MNNKTLASALTTALVAFSSTGTVLAVPEYNGDSGPPALGQVTVGLDSYGGFGSDVFNARDIGDAVFGAAFATEGTTVSSFLAARFGTGAETAQLTGPAQYIGSGSEIKTETNLFYPVTYAAPGGTVTPDGSPTATRIESSFTSSTLQNLDFRLVQTIDRFDTNPSGTEQGTFLQQDYEITNNTGAAVSGELLRYAAFALSFVSGSTSDDGGGRRVIDGKDYLFTTESVVSDNDDTVYAAISAEILNQTAQTANRFEFGDRTGFNITADHVLASGENAGGFIGIIPALSNAVVNDGGSGLVNVGSRYASALRNAFTIANGSSITYRTTTYWGEGKISEFVPPSNGGGNNPVPAPGSLMLLGLAGWGLSRFRKHQIGR